MTITSAPWAPVLLRGAAAAAADPEHLDEAATAQLELEDRVDHVLEVVRAELLSACTKFPAMHSPHEALGVIREEYIEFEREVFGDKRPGARARMTGEALQVAAMFARALVDVVDVLPFGAHAPAARGCARAARFLLDLGGAR